jgi:hypothetical protein
MVGTGGASWAAHTGVLWATIRATRWRGRAGWLVVLGLATRMGNGPVRVSWPKTVLEIGNPLLIFKPFSLIANSFVFKRSLNYERLSTSEIKYGSTSSHNKICNVMNATNTIIYLYK